MIYIHIPYCHQKCTYCAFYSTAARDNSEEYVEALCHEIALRANERETQAPVRTVYFGGGTPSILSTKQLYKIIESLRRHFPLDNVEEATIECNPEDLSIEYLAALADLRFFNRLSIGVQSFDNERLHRLNRRHTSTDVDNGIAYAESKGFDNISVDLIYGQPDESAEEWGNDLQHLSSLVAQHPSIKHLSAYSLTIEEGTMLRRQIAQGKISPPNEDTVLQHYYMLQRWIAANGFEQYEVSNYCRKGFASLHNSRYWDRTPYIGFGAAAHSFDGTHRRWNIANTANYITGVTAKGLYFDKETLTDNDAYNEYIMTALRTPQGIDKAMIAPRYMAHLKKATKRYLSTNLLTETETHYLPTAEGLLRADGIAADLFVD